MTAAAAMLAAPASGAIINLSTNSSEPGIDPSLLSATLEFQITGVLLNELTLTITNNTSAPNEFVMNRIYFNFKASSNVTGLTLANQPANGASWGLVPFDPDFPLNTAADSFGSFDILLRHGPPEGHNHHLIKSGESAVFTFAIQGTGPFFDTDFIGDLSQQFDHNDLMFAAAKFVMGPGDASAFGGNVPEPGTVALLGLAGLLALRRRRRPT
ncbi:MAG: PEP-CTERM sorting domain-containing protein [Planctomycetota bacterium]|nr:PEP-CTERM sorting domain-containing protein [Planctomycetota bacterium]